MRYYYIQIKILLLTKQTDHNKCWQKCGGTEHSFTAGVNVKWFNHVKWFDNFIKLNIYLPCDPTSWPLGTLEKKKNRKKAYIYTETFPWMFIALFAMGKNWKQHKYPSANGRINKLWYILAKKYYSPIKNNKLLMHETMWMSLKIIVLSENKTDRKVCILSVLIYIKF